MPAVATGPTEIVPSFTQTPTEREASEWEARKSRYDAWRERDSELAHAWWGAFDAQEENVCEARTRIAARAAIWLAKLARHWSRGRFDTYIGKPKAVDNFYRGIREDGPVIKHFDGAAKWSHIKGCAVAPNNLIKWRSKMAFGGRQEEVDEYLTTQCCWKCHARTRPVERCVHGKGRKVRGLVFCDSKTFCRLTNRDFQGAHNIGVCGQGPRPERLTRQAPGKCRNDVVALPLCQSMRCLGG